MASEAVAQNLIDVIQKRVRLVTSQSELGIPLDKLLHDQCMQIQMLFANTDGIDVDCVTAVSGEIAKGPWTPTQKSVLATALSESSMDAGKKHGK
eukprot:2677127-Pyramimonas_sp.AAC.1